MLEKLNLVFITFSLELTNGWYLSRLLLLRALLANCKIFRESNEGKLQMSPNSKSQKIKMSINVIAFEI